MRTENYNEGSVHSFDKTESLEEKLDLVQTQIAGTNQPKSKKDLEDYASYLRIKIEEEKNKGSLPN